MNRLASALGADWSARSWWMNFLFYFCVYVTILYIPFDLFAKPSRPGGGGPGLCSVRFPRLREVRHYAEEALSRHQLPTVMHLVFLR
jgi:hypothetical protein